MHRIGLLIGLVLASGCGGYVASYRQIETPTVLSNRRESDAEMFLDSKPTRLYQNVAFIIARNEYHFYHNLHADPGEAVNLLRKTAVEMHLDGVHSIRCAAPDAVEWGTCEGVGFVYVQNLPSAAGKI
jgi:hypothetical protein